MRNQSVWGTLVNNGIYTITNYQKLCLQQLTLFQSSTAFPVSRFNSIFCCKVPVTSSTTLALLAFVRLFATRRRFEAVGSVETYFIRQTRRRRCRPSPSVERRCIVNQCVPMGRPTAHGATGGRGREGGRVRFPAAAFFPPFHHRRAGHLLRQLVIIVCLRVSRGNGEKTVELIASGESASRARGIRRC